MKSAESFFTKEQKDIIVRAIKDAEKQTSGEIRVFIENTCKGDILDRAAYLFRKLGMTKTCERNGILFYLSIARQQFAILGDTGIHAKVPEGFWDSVRDKLEEHFKTGDFTGGLSEGIRMAGDKLKTFFPRKLDDVNELSDEITFGKH
jgi:uncharacterized membrane protein